MRAQVVSLVLLALLAGAQAAGSITKSKSAPSVHDIMAAKGMQITKTVATPATNVGVTAATKTATVEFAAAAQNGVAVNAGGAGFTKSMVGGRRLSFFAHGGKNASVSVGKGGIQITKSFVTPAPRKPEHKMEALNVEVQKTAAFTATKNVTATKAVASFTKSLSGSGGKGASLFVNGRKLSMLGKGVSIMAVAA